MTAAGHGMTPGSPSRHDGLLGVDDSPTVHDFLMMLRRTHVPDWTPPGKRQRVIAGRTVKAAVQLVAQYADFITDEASGRAQGRHAHPALGELAVSLQVSYREVQECMKAAVAMKLIEMTKDNRAQNLPSEYRLLNPMGSGLAVLDPDAFQEAGRQARVKDKGASRKAPPKLAEVVRIHPRAPEETIKTRGTRRPPGSADPGDETSPDPGDETSPPPITHQSSSTNPDIQVRSSTHDRACATPEEDPQMSAVQTARPAPLTGGPRHRQHRPRRAWTDDGSGPEPARYRRLPPATEQDQP